MFQSVVHLVVASVLAALTVAAVRVWHRDRRSYTVIVAAVLAGLTYDNAILGLGRWVGEGAVLESLTWPRFVIHAFATPLLVIVGFGAARAFGLGWAQRRDLHTAFCVVATGLVAWGVFSEVVGLQLEATSEGGVLSYGAADAGAPVPAIATIVVLVGVGASMWRAVAWPWLAVGAAVMFVASGLGGISGLLTNVGELALAASLVITEHEGGRRQRSWSVAARSPSWARSTAPARSRISSRALRGPRALTGPRGRRVPSPGPRRPQVPATSRRAVRGPARG